MTSRACRAAKPPGFSSKSRRRRPLQLRDFVRGKLDLALSAPGGGEGRGEVGGVAAADDGRATHLTLPIAAGDGSPPSPPASGRRGQDPKKGRLLANLMHFARTLRAAGLPVGPGKVIDAVAAISTVGITNRTDFYWTLHAVFVNRPDQRLIFDQAFHVFWRNPDLLKKMLGLILPEMRIEASEERGTAMARRLAEA